MNPIEKLKQLIEQDIKSGKISISAFLEYSAIIDHYENNPIHTPTGNLSGINYSGILKDIAWSDENYCNELILRSF